MIPKTPKIKDKYLLHKYKELYPYCEPCRLFTGNINNQYLESHHIRHGVERTDETWNIINLCKEHHILATHHYLEGIQWRDWNKLYFAIKLVKNEVSPSILSKFRIYEDVQFYYEKIINKKYNEIELIK